MKVYQTYNPRIKAYVKFKIDKNGSRIVNVKQTEPMKPFKGIRKKGLKK